MGIDKLGRDYREAKARLGELHVMLFDGDREEILDRLKRVCRLLSVGYPNTGDVASPRGMEHWIADFPLVNLLHNDYLCARNYPCPQMDFDMEEGNVVVRIRAVTGGDVQGSTEVSFPCDTGEYNEYVEHLLVEAKGRLDDERKGMLLKIEQHEKKEREIYEELKKKYG